jgi:hypothetical protein
MELDFIIKKDMHIFMVLMMFVLIFVQSISKHGKEGNCMKKLKNLTKSNSQKLRQVALGLFL